MKHAIVLLTAIFISLQGFAQFIVSGIISDESGQVLEGANIFIENTFIGAISDKQGHYTLENISPGKKIIHVTYIGYESKKRIIELQGNLREDFILEQSLILGEEAIINGIRAGKNDPVAFSMITKDEINELNLGQDMPFLLSISPSIVVTSDAGAGVGYTGFRIRGTDANRINITVNGIPLNDAESHGVWFVDIPDFAGSTENIQIQRGVGTSTNGAAAFGASINLQTLSLNKKPYAQVNNGFGSFNTMKNSAGFGTGLINNRFSFDGRLSWLHSDGFIDRASSNLNSLFISGTSVSEKSLLRLIIFSGQEKTYQAWDGVPSYLLDSLRTYNGIGMYKDESGNIKYYDNETDNYNQTNYQLHYSRDLSQTVNVTGAIHLTRGIGYYEQYKEDQDLIDYNIADILTDMDTINQSDLIRRKWLDNYFYGGIFSVKIKKNKIGAVIGGAWNKYDGNHYGTVIWARNAGNSEINHRWYENSGLKKEYNSFAKLNYSISELIHIYSDLQIRGMQYSIKGLDDDQRNITQDHTFLFFNPKAGINFRINNNQRAFFSFAVANREPNRDNFVDADPAQPVPKPETLYDYELGYDYHTETFLTGMNLYYMDYTNQLVLTGEINDVGSPVMTNVRDSYRVGVELTARLKISELLSWDINLTLSRNKIKKFTAYVDNWDYWNNPANEQLQYQFKLGTSDIAFSPAIIAGSSLKLIPYKDFKIIFNSKYVGRQYIDNTSSIDRQLDPWFVNDLRMDYTLHLKKIEQLKFNILIANIFNEKYESNAWVYRYISNGHEYRYDGYFPQAGINFLAGLNISF